MVDGSALTYTVEVAFDEFPEPTTPYYIEKEDHSTLITVALIAFFSLLGIVLLAAAIFYMLRQ